MVAVRFVFLAYEMDGTTVLMSAECVNLLRGVFLDRGRLAIINNFFHQCRHRWRKELLKRVAGQPNDILPRSTLACEHSTGAAAFAPVAVWMHCETISHPTAVSDSQKPEDIEYIVSLDFSAGEI